MGGVDRRRGDGVGGAPGQLGGFRCGVRGGGEGVLLVAGDLVALGDVRGGGAHVIAVKGVPQPVLDQGVDERQIAHLAAVPEMGAVGREAHVLLAAGDDDLALALVDRHLPEDDRAQPRAAEMVDAVGRHAIGQAGADGGLTRRVLALPGGQHLAHDDLGGLVGGNAGTLHRFGEQNLFCFFPCSGLQSIRRILIQLPAQRQGII